MSLTESHVEDAALEWFLLRNSYGGQVGKLGDEVGQTKRTFHLPNSVLLSPEVSARMPNPF